jgi:hypothetical protein
MDYAAIIKEAPYIAALVLIVVIFTRSMEAAARKQTEGELERDKQWREFLTEQRTQNTAALSRLSAEITSVSAAVATVHSEQLRHDSWMRESVDVMKARARKGNTTPRTNE